MCGTRTFTHARPRPEAALWQDVTEISRLLRRGAGYLEAFSAITKCWKTAIFLDALSWERVFCSQSEPAIAHNTLCDQCGMFGS